MSANYKDNNLHKEGVSVIVCCYNSSLRLDKTLSCLVRQEVFDVAWEIIIVDNNSTDGTADIAKAALKKQQSPVPYKVIFEPVAGLSSARKAGYENASYSYLLFCDDDNWLDKFYVQYAYNIMSSLPGVGIAVGNSTAAFEDNNEPSWFRKYQASFAVGKIIETSGYVNHIKHLSGAAMVVRKEVFDALDKLNFEPVLSGRKGKTVSSGEDSELSLVTYYLGYDLYYDDRLSFVHYMPKERLTWSYYVRMATKGIAVSRIHLYFYNYCHGKTTAGSKSDFEYAYKRSIIKCLKSIKAECSNVRELFMSLKLIFFSSPGSHKETRLRASVEKLKFLLLNRSLLREDFTKIDKIVSGISKQTEPTVQL